MGKFSTHRNCPRCGAGQGRARLWFFNWAWAQWDCPSCGTRLGFSIGRRVALVVFQFPIFAVAMLAAMSGEWLLCIAATVLWVPTWRFDSIRVVEGVEAREVFDGARSG